MGQVHFAMMTGAAGFSRIVAIKRLHSEYSQDPRMRSRFEREARLSSRIVHPNVVQVLDVLQLGDDLMFVMEYVAGDTLRALRLAAGKCERIPLDVVTAIIVSALHGLHAAHETRDEQGRPLSLVHRDFSPDNVMIGQDGEVKVLDFGVAKVAQEALTTNPGSIAGKLCYMSPEQALGRELDARSDVFAAGVVLWEMLVGERLFREKEASPAAILYSVLNAEITPPSRMRQDVPAALERVVMRALQRDVGARFTSAREFALALEEAVSPASAFNVGLAVQRFCGPSLAARADSLARFRATLSGQQTLEFRNTLGLDASFADTSFSESYSFGEFSLDENRPAVQPASRRRAMALGGLALLCGGAALAWKVLLGAQATHAPAALHGPDPAQPQLGISHSPAAGELPVASSASARTEAASLSGEPPSPSSSAVRESVSRPLNRGRPRQAASVALSCSTPTYVDAEGIRHFKPECL
jgi:serine/threonine-protein kinase